MQYPENHPFFIPDHVFESSSLAIVDVRTDEEFIERNLEGTLLIPLAELPERHTELANYENIIVFCLSGIRSEHAKEFLLREGYQNVYNGGGFEEFVERLDGKGIELA